jgi:hypothetical protein
VLVKEIGKNSVKKLEERLFEKYGKAIFEVVEEWDKIDEILHEQYAGGAAKITSKYIAKIAQASQSSGKYPKNIISDPKTVKKIMRVLGDDDSSKVINYLLSNTNTIQNITKKTHIPQTSGYRKIEELIELGMIVENGYDISRSTGRKIKKYYSPFKSISIIIEKSTPMINFVPKKNVTLQIA